ncbi:hypothetical protein [Brevibacillus laterosporus]|uniref:hypothetical protein n=1 Tax=Brevibacillus laterosporus TaxID=1465 RepID=UPI000B9A2DD7|nr:hypothetical protein [Brevibacillus laterosporus]
MVTLDSTISFLIYITAVSSAAAGVTEIAKSAIPFLTYDYVPDNESYEAHCKAGKKQHLKKLFNLVFSVLAAGCIFAELGLDPAQILMGTNTAYVADAWGARIWTWGIVAVFGSPLFHSILKILQGYQQTVSSHLPPKPKQKIDGK